MLGKDPSLASWRRAAGKPQRPKVKQNRGGFTDSCSEATKLLLTMTVANRSRGQEGPGLLGFWPSEQGGFLTVMSSRPLPCPDHITPRRVSWHPPSAESWMP